MGVTKKAATWRSCALVLGLALMVRVPFLSQPVQGDDVYYLAAAEHAQIDPLHPNHASYVFLGKTVTMRGHPHPPLNGWFLGGLLALLSDIREVPFHAAYISFSLIAVFSMWMLAGQFSPRPLLATLLFIATPAFLVNGNSLESDLPFLAFWMAAVAGFVRAVDRRSPAWLAASAFSMALSAMAAFQSIFLVPILAFYLWKHGRGWKPAWIALLTVPTALGGWQLWERWSSGALPAAVLAGYFQSYGLQTAVAKWKNAVALTVHLGWLVFPPLIWRAARHAGWVAWAAAGAAAAGGALWDPNPLFWLCLGTGVLVLAWCAGNSLDFPAAWILLFFSGALVVFFAGSARYLLPVAAPVALLASRVGGWAGAAGVVCQLSLGLALATANYTHWDGYRQFARVLPAESDGKRVWINGEWGLRYYAEERGGLPLLEGQAVQPGEYVISSELGYPVPFSTGGGRLTTIARQEIRTWPPLVLIGLHSRSAYSTAALGLRAFDISREPVDRVRLEVVVERKPTLSDIPMDHPEAGFHIVSGIYHLEGNARWMAGKAVVLLKRPQVKSVLRAVVYIPDAAPARRITLTLNGAQVAADSVPGPGLYTVRSAPIPPEEGEATVGVIVDKTFQIATDRRELGVVLGAVGFVSP